MSTPRALLYYYDYVFIKTLKKKQKNNREGAAQAHAVRRVGAVNRKDRKHQR